MAPTAVLGVLVAALAGLCMGTSPWPLKLMRRYRYEHFAPIAMLVALVVVPWSVTLAFCPAPLAALRSIPASVLVQSNLFSLGFGIAQVLAMICFLRIGVSLTYGILTAAGASVGVIIPLVFKGSGPFADAPDLFSAPGIAVLIGVVVMIGGIYLATLAGFGREKLQQETETRKSGFVAGLVMVVIAGVLSAGLLFVFVYSAGPIKEAMAQQGANPLVADLAVWSFGLLGAAAVNTLYPLYLLWKSGSWKVFGEAPQDIALAVLYGAQFFAAIAIMGEGAILLQGLGGSVGWGTQQGFQVIGGTFLGFFAGEWRGVVGTPRRQIFAAISVIVLAVAVLTYSKVLS